MLLLVISTLVKSSVIFIQPAGYNGDAFAQHILKRMFIEGVFRTFNSYKQTTQRKVNIMTNHYSGPEAEVSSMEFYLITQGFHQVQKTNDKDLQPFEYIKSFHRGSASSFEGEITYRITWVE